MFMHPIIPCTETILQNVVPANVCAARRELRIPENFPPWATETPAVNRQLGSGRDTASASSTRPRHPAHVLSCAMDACLRNETEIFEHAVVATINVPIPNDVRSPVQTICDQFVVWGLDFQCRTYTLPRYNLLLHIDFELDIMTRCPLVIVSINRLLFGSVESFLESHHQDSRGM